MIFRVIGAICTHWRGDAARGIIKDAILALSLVGVLLALQSCDGDSSAYEEAVDAGDLNIDRIEVISELAPPANEAITINAGEEKQFAANGVTKSGDKTDLTSRVRWSTTDSSLATIDKKGLLTSKMDGVVTVNAVLAQFSGSTNLTISTANIVGIAIDGGSEVSECKNLQLNAIGTFDDDSRRTVTDQLTWSVTGSDLVSIDNAGLLATTGSASVEVTAESSGIPSEKLPITVRDDLTKIDVTTDGSSKLEIEKTQNYRATGQYTDGTKTEITSNASWKTDSVDIATIGNAAADKGKLTAQSAGTTNVQADCGGLTGSALLTVLAEVTLESVEITGDDRIRVGDTRNLTLKAKFSDDTDDDVTEDEATFWEVVDSGSSDPGSGVDVVSVSETGEVTGISKGEERVRATYTFKGIDRSDIFSIEVIE